MAREPVDFAEFYASSKDDCLRAVLASTGDMPAAEELVAEAFARAWAAWRSVSRHVRPGPGGTMNTDSELLTAVRESFAGARLRAPLDATIRRGRRLRTAAGGRPGRRRGHRRGCGAGHGVAAPRRGRSVGGIGASSGSAGYSPGPAGGLDGDQGTGRYGDHPDPRAA